MEFNKNYLGWKQIYDLSGSDDKKDQLLDLLQHAEVAKNRPEFFGVRYISPRHIKQSIPSNKVFLASSFSLLSHYVALDKVPVLAVFGMVVNFALIAFLVTFRLRRVLMEIQGRTLTM